MHPAESLDPMNLCQPPAALRPDLKSHWLLDERVTFLNHGSFGACPRVAVEAQADWQRRIEAEPIEILGRRADELLAPIKRQLGDWLGMLPADFGLLTNATEGVNAVLNSLDLAPGDELLTTNHVYFAVRQSMHHVAQKGKAIYREVQLPLPLISKEDIADRVLAAVGERTRLLVIDHITSSTAIVFPIEQIVAGCAERGVDVLVDGAHAPGMVPLEIADIGTAYYAGNLHKWACCPKGCAFLWVRPDRQAGIHPLVISHYFEQGFEREFSWQGTRDRAAWLAIPKALGFITDLGWDRVMSHNHAMAVWVNQMLCERWNVPSISPLDGHLLGSMATVPLPAPLDRLDAAATAPIQQQLYSEFKIEVPIMPWSNRSFIRPCCQVYNTPADYERLADIISTICSQQRIQ